ncbi:DUF2382 domain-containing protein [Agrococcus jenensis]|uniref:Uncharacterized protein (TIGR02271 family) n=1 Tax=Agrococcus jenensis TaxID=46353 RepID=A0A3N2AQL8_9MICO|nr:PRC and DUF2382 domain-containing protein [Agrococcus jenensis]ROR65208.1 uncharacterized protein (TIGR02271 family) [Agrococcus jenensis]
MTDSNGRTDALSDGTIYDSSGAKVGRVTQVYLDDATGEPAFATVSTGWFGARESFVPIDAAAVEGDEIRVPYDKELMRGAPSVEADTHLTEAEEDELYRYYGLGGSAGSVGSGGHDHDHDHDHDHVAGQHFDEDLGTTPREVVDADDASVVRREEQLHVGTERVETGRVRLRKHVVTERESVTVPVERDELEVVREPLDGTAASTGALGDDEIDVRLTEERPVVDKEVVDAERIGLDRRTVTDQETVRADVAREEVDIDKDGDVRR